MRPDVRRSRLDELRPKSAPTGYSGLWALRCLPIKRHAYARFDRLPATVALTVIGLRCAPQVHPHSSRHPLGSFRAHQDQYWPTSARRIRLHLSAHIRFNHTAVTPTMGVSAQRAYPIAISLTVLYVAHRLWRLSKRRSRTLPRSHERVLVIGASSGIGRSMAHEYASAGARVCVVGRREQELNAVADECASLLPKAAVSGGGGERGSGGEAFSVVADFTNPEDMVTLRKKLEERRSHDVAIWNFKIGSN